MKFLVATAAVLIAATLTPAANADNYGTSPARAKASAAQVYRAFGGGYVGNCMVRIMWRESAGNPLAANYGDSNGGSYGLLQLNGAHRWIGETVSAFRARMWNVKTHLQAAVRLFITDKADPRPGHDGFYPWGGCP